MRAAYDDALDILQKAFSAHHVPGAPTKDIVIEILREGGEIAMEARDYERAASLWLNLNRALSMSTRSKDDPVRAIASLNYAITRAVNGETKESLTVLANTQAWAGAADPSTARFAHQALVILKGNDLGDYEQAPQPISEKEADQILAYAMDVAKAHQKNGAHAAARVVIEKSLMIAGSTAGAKQAAIAVQALNAVNKALGSRPRDKRIDIVLLQRLERNPNITASVLAVRRITLANALRIDGHSREADIELTKAIQTLGMDTTADGSAENANRYSLALNSRALTRLSLGREADALADAYQALAIARQGNASDQALRNSLFTVAWTLKAMRRFHEAAPMGREYVARTAAAVGETHPETRSARARLAAILDGAGAEDEVKALIPLIFGEEVMDGRAEPDEFIQNANFGTILIGYGFDALALRVTQASLDSAIKRFPEGHHYRVQLMKDHSDALRANRRPDEARKYLALAIEQAENGNGISQERIAGFVAALGMVDASRRDYDAASHSLRRAVATYDERPAEQGQTVASGSDVRVTLATLISVLWKLQEAAPPP